jgi:hypothetical protein
MSLVTENFSALPDELILEIFSHLNLASLGKISLVCKGWKRLGCDPILWKTVIYRDVAFGNDKWARAFGKEVVKDEDNREEFSSLPWNEFIADCKTFKCLFPEKNAKDRLMLVRLPKTLNGALTLRNLGELAKKYFPYNYRGYGYIWFGIANALDDNPMDKSRWVLMTRDVLSGSKEKCYEDQLLSIAALAEKSLMCYEVPGLVESTACILSQYFMDSKTRLFSDNPWTFTNCKTIQNHQTVVGGFCPDGLSIHWDPTIARRYVGMAVMRKF